MLQKLLADKMEADGLTADDVAFGIRKATGIRVTAQTVANHVDGGTPAVKALKAYNMTFGWTFEDMIGGVNNAQTLPDLPE